MFEDHHAFIKVKNPLRLREFLVDGQVCGEFWYSMLPLS